MESGADDVAGALKATGGDLANTVGELVGGRAFFAGGDVDVSHFDEVISGTESFGVDGNGRRQPMRKDKEKQKAEGKAIFKFHRCAGRARG